MNTRVEQCHKCHFADNARGVKDCPADKTFTCHRNPPVVVVNTNDEEDVGECWQDDQYSYWQPAVRGGDWCGEFRPRSEGKAP